MYYVNNKVLFLIIIRKYVPPSFRNLFERQKRGREERGDNGWWFVAGTLEKKKRKKKATKCTKWVHRRIYQKYLYRFYKNSRKRKRRKGMDREMEISRGPFIVLFYCLLTHVLQLMFFRIINSYTIIIILSLSPFHS